MRDLVHFQMIQSDEGPRADGARVPRLILHIVVLVFRPRGMARTHVIVQLKGTSELQAARGTWIGLREDLHLVE